MQVVKVLHGADSDIVWLQRDFGIYITNMFDTGQAARVLGYPSAGLAYLLSRFCKVKVMVVRANLSLWSGTGAAFDRLPLLMLIAGGHLATHPEGDLLVLVLKMSGGSRMPQLRLFVRRPTSAGRWQTGGFAHCLRRRFCMHAWTPTTSSTCTTSSRYIQVSAVPARNVSVTAWRHTS